MNYLVCVNLDKSDKIKYIVPVSADDDMSAGIKAHAVLKRLHDEGYKYVEIRIAEDEHVKSF